MNLRTSSLRTPQCPWDAQREMRLSVAADFGRSNLPQPSALSVRTCRASPVHMQAHGEGETLTAARCDECEVTTRWLGFYRVWQGSGEVFDTVDLFLPDVQFNTQVTGPE